MSPSGANRSRRSGVRAIGSTPMASRSPSRLGHSRVRSRATVAACAMVGVFTIVFAFAFLTLLRRTLIAEVDDSANEAVHDLSLEASQGLLPNLSAAPPDADSFVQVVNAAGRVTEGSSNVVGKPPIAWHPARPAAKRTMGSPVAGLNGDFRVAALSAP